MSVHRWKRTTEFRTGTLRENLHVRRWLLNSTGGLKTVRKITGDRVSPWSIPRLISNGGVFHSLVFTVADSLGVSNEMCKISPLGSLMCTRMSVIKAWVTEPKAFWRSRKVTARGIPCWIVLSMIAVVVRICSAVPLMPVRNPFEGWGWLCHLKAGRFLGVSLISCGIAWEWPMTWWSGESYSG